MTAPATGTSQAISGQALEVAFVLLVDGYNLGWTTHADVSGIDTAWAADSDWSVIRAGLTIPSVIQQSCLPFDATIQMPGMTFTIVDAAGDISSVFEREASSDAVNSRLALLPTASLDSSQTFAVLQPGVASFPTTGTVYVGTEEITYTINAGNTILGGFTRGMRALFGTYSTPTKFGRPHDVDMDAGHAPLVSTAPGSLVGRHVGLYMSVKKADGTWTAGLPGTADSTTTSECIWAGRVQSLTNHGDGRYTIEAAHILEQLKGTILRRQLRAYLEEGTYLLQGQDGYFGVQVIRTELTGGAQTAYSASTSSLLPASDLYTHDEYAALVNDQLLAWFNNGGGVYFPTAMQLSLGRTGPDGYYTFTFSDTTAGTYGWQVIVWAGNGLTLLGFTYPADIKTEWIGGLVNWRLVFGNVASPFSSPPPSNPPQRSAISFRRDSIGVTRIKIRDVQTGTEFEHQPNIPAEFPRTGTNATQGFLRIGGPGGYVLAVRESDTVNEYIVVGAMDERHAVLGAKPVTTTSFFNFSESLTNDGVVVEQVWYDAGRTGDLFLRLLLSTGTSGYSHPDWDSLPRQMGLGLPYYLVDAASFYVVLGLSWYVLFIDKPSPFIERLESALAARNLHLALVRGQITVVPFGEDASATVSLTEDNKAAAVTDTGEVVTDRCVVSRTSDNLINQVTLRYNHNLAPSDVIPEWKEITVNQADSQGDLNQTRAAVVDGHGYYEDLPGLGGGIIQEWSTRTAASALAYFSRPLALVERSYDYTLLASLYPGARVLLTDNHVTNPVSGVAGVSGLPAWCVSTAFDLGTGVGHCQLLFAPHVATTTTHAVLPPSARVDETYTGQAADATTVALYKFNELAITSDYTTLHDDSASGRDLTETNASIALNSGRMTHIVNGPSATVRARYFPGVAIETHSVAPVFLKRTGDTASRTLFQSGTYTIEAWIRAEAPLTANGQATILDYGMADTSATEATNHQALLKYIDTGELFFGWEHDAGSATNSTVTTVGAGLDDGEWHHIGVYVDQTGATGTVGFVIDGTFLSETTGLTKPTGGTDGAVHYGVGAYGQSSAWGDSFRGAIRSLRISSVLRSTASIAASAALTTYTHETDTDTFAHWACDESPDAFEETAYGYHARKVAGSIAIVDPLAPDGGKARNMAATSYYAGHWKYEPLRAALTDDWTFECWTKMLSGYEAATNTIWTHGTSGETQATNGVAMQILTTRVLRTAWEYSAGTNANKDTTAAIFSTVGAGENTHHVALTFYETSPGNYSLEFYFDGALVETLTTTTRYDGGTDAALMLAVNSTADIFNGHLDDMRWSSGRRSSTEIAATYAGGWLYGYHSATKTLRLKAHEYSRSTDAVDASHFAAADKVRLVQRVASSEQIVADTVASVDAANNQLTLTTGLGGALSSGERYDLEYDDVATVVASQRAGYVYLADANTLTTGHTAGDARTYAGERTAALDTAVSYYGRHGPWGGSTDDQGEPLSVHKLHELHDWCNTALAYHTSNRVFEYVQHALVASYTYVEATDTSSYTLLLGPIWLPLYGGARPLRVRAWAARGGGTSAVIQVITSTGIVRGSDSSFRSTTSEPLTYPDGGVNSTSLYVNQSGYDYTSEETFVPAVVSGAPPGCWLTVTALASAGGYVRLGGLWIHEAPLTTAGPHSVPGLAAWYDAGSLLSLADGDPVVTWRDLSGHANHATQTTATSVPTYQTAELNGWPVVRFDGTDDFLSVPDSDTYKTAALTIFVVAKSVATTGTYRTMVGYPHDNAGGAPSFRWSLQHERVAGAVVSIVDGGSAVSTTASMASWTMLTLDTATWRVWHDQALIANGTDDDSIQYPNAVGMRIGNGTDNTFWHGDIAEILIYGRTLSDADRALVESYLISKYAL